MYDHCCTEGLVRTGEEGRQDCSQRKCGKRKRTQGEYLENILHSAPIALHEIIVRLDWVNDLLNLLPLLLDSAVPFFPLFIYCISIIRYVSWRGQKTTVVC